VAAGVEAGERDGLAGADFAGQHAEGLLVDAPGDAGGGFGVGPLAMAMLEHWCAWAQRSRIPAFVELGRRIRRHWAGIAAAMEHGLSKG